LLKGLRVVEYLAHLDAAGNQVFAGGVDVVHGENQVCSPNQAWRT
jgi:hypothetical protein